ncbi:MAG: DUF5063 domain-containing protein [Actinomycetes bacterium]
MSDDLSEFTTEIADQIGSFVVAVREIARGDEPQRTVSLLLLQMSQLMLAGGRLGAIADVIPQERFEPDAGPDPDVEELRVRLSALLEPIDEYTEVFDPYLSEPEIVTNSLSDDVADVTADLLHGLQHYRAGRTDEALWWWQFSYLSNWGGTGSAALRALQSVVSHSRLDVAAEVELTGGGPQRVGTHGV